MAGDTGGADIRERTFNFAVRVVKLCEYLDERPGVNRALARQLIRSGTAVGANLEEAKAGHSKADFIAKCEIALKEARETLYWLRLLVKTGCIPEDRLGPLQVESNQIVSILTAIIVAARKGRQSDPEQR